MLLGCIADDLTGATDLCLTLSREGLRTVQTTGVPRPSKWATSGSSHMGSTRITPSKSTLPKPSR